MTAEEARQKIEAYVVEREDDPLLGAPGHDFRVQVRPARKGWTFLVYVIDSFGEESIDRAGWLDNDGRIQEAT